MPDVPNPLFKANPPAANPPEMKTEKLVLKDHYQYPGGPLMIYTGKNENNGYYQFGYSRDNELGGLVYIDIPQGGIGSLIHVPRTKAAGRRRTRRMMFKKWAAQEAREMSHKGKRMTFRKWAANELKEKSHPGNPSFKKWARQEMREKSHTRRRR